MPNIFSPPVATHRAGSTSWGLQSPRKRKRLDLDGEVEQVKEQGTDGSVEPESSSRSDASLEYTAVVTPEQRHQRRVAGQPLDEEPPPLPFPHAEAVGTKSKPVREALLEGTTGAYSSKSAKVPQSLHMQHLAALTTILHRSLLREDFTRASRALGLMFREDTISQNAAVRSQGYMGIAAEVLLRSGYSRDSASVLPRTALPFTQEGFQKAKRFYERLIVRHPYHKSWPDAVNAVDFYLAMFNIWIYAVYTESTSMSHSGEVDDDVTDADRKVRELEQANQIAARIDACMATVPYIDEPELIRLRAMVSLWQADLHEDCAYMDESIGVEVSDPIPGPNEQSLLPGKNEHMQEAVSARDKAQELLSKLADPAASDSK